MTTLATSENTEKTRKIELWTMWGCISIIIYTKKDGEYERTKSIGYKRIDHACKWYREYEARLLGLKPEEMHPPIKVKIDSEGEISLLEEK